MEDKCLESKKQSQLIEDTSVKSSSSSNLKCHDEQEIAIKSDEATEIDALQKPASQASLEDDVDESDVEEEDVKVCDICGDAGREDLLAVCSRCSDGAEHTYCMREMLDKVPEGDWICEECRFNEELEAQKPEQPKILGTSERSKSAGRTGSVNYDLSPKLDNKDPISEWGKMKHVSLNKLPSKRPGDNIETGATSKRQALESDILSPKMSSPGRIPALSKDSSFKSLDKPKRKLTNQISSGTESTSDSSENVRSPSTSSLHAIKGNFLKSNSFSSANSKPNIKVTDEGSHKQKQGVDAKDGPGKLMGKSTSFKGLGRSSVSEPKVKMFSPKCAPVDELKCQKQARDRISFERKSTIKLDPSFVGQMGANATKRPFRGDNVSTLSVTNNVDHKNAQTDGKIPTTSKHAFHSVNRSSDSTAGSAEVKRQLSTSVSGAASVNGTTSSFEAKPTHVSLKEGPTISSSRTADRSYLGANGAKADIFDSQSEKSLDNPFSRSKQNVSATMVGGNRRGLSSDPAGLRTKEGVHEENKLKAAIEAAMQKKQDIFKKHRIPEKPVELSMPNTQGNRVEDAVSNQVRDTVSEEAVQEGDGVLRENISSSCNQMSTSSVKQLKVYPADFVISSIEESAMTVSAIPEQESIWQGAFEIHRIGKLPDICGGFQAHLSTFASDKVLNVVKKFPHKLVLDEVVRPCAWPVQFKEIGAREDNIALYFFAKDLESYVRSYKILLDYLIKHDLALRGNISGVELLVFPSNHLPDKSQCWNTLFFMWGVFRGRKSHSPDRGSGSLESPEISTSNMITQDKHAVSATSMSEDPCSHRPEKVEDLSVSGSGLVVSACEPSVSVVSPSNGDCYNQQSGPGRTSVSPKRLSENSHKGPPNDCSQSSGAEGCLQTGRSAMKVQDHRYEDDDTPISQQQLNQDVDKGNHLHEAEKLGSFNKVDEQDSLSHTSKVVPTMRKESGSAAICNRIDKVKCDDRLKQEQGCLSDIKSTVQGNLENDGRKQEGEMDCLGKNDRGKLKLEGGFRKAGYVDINVSADCNMEDFSDVHSTESIFTCQKREWIDRKDASKCEDKISSNERMVDGFSGCDLQRLPSSFGDSLAAQMCGPSTSSRVEDISNKIDDDKSASQRYFFLVDSHPTQSTTHSRDDSMPWKVDLSENEDRLLDGSPNLELALGVEKKEPRKGILPFFAGIVDKNDPDGPPDIETSKEDEDASASLSLSLAFPFSDKERTKRIEKPTTNVEQVLPGRHEVNSPLLFFRGSSGK